MTTNSAASVSSQPNIFSQAWKRWFTVRSTDPDEVFRERTIRGMIPILAVFVILIAVFLISTHDIAHPEILVATGMVVIAAAAAMTFRKLNIAAVLVFLFPVLAMVAGFKTWGYLSTGGTVMAFFAVLFGAVVLPRRITPFLPIGMVISYGLIAVSVGANGPVRDLTDKVSPGPITQTVELGVLSTVFFGLGYYLLNEFENRRKQLTILVGTLEDRVAERTRDLTVAANVAQEITQVLNLEKLLPKLSELTRTSFSLYHVSIFLLDEATNTLRLQAGSGEAGRQMVSQHKQFRVDEHGLVPLAGRERRPQIINDVLKSNDHEVNPILPNTRAETALPMSIGHKLIGVLDLQSEQLNKFSDDDIKVLTTLAEQIAIAVRNAQLFEEAYTSRKEAEQANRVKSQFLASMSHELRTPLNAILNFTQFVSTGILGSVNDEQVSTLNKVVQSGQHLLSLINDVLDISKIEAGALKLFIEPNVDLKHEATTVVDAASGLLHEKPIKLQVEIADNLPLILGDKRRIRQIMLNLVSNACKFTETGSIRIVLEKQKDDVLFVVQDTGPGIAPEDAELVFEVFRQTSTGLHQGEGTGLGLPISRRLAEAHGGRLWVQSVLGQGSSFYVSLPINSPKLQQPVAIVEESQYVA